MMRHRHPNKSCFCCGTQLPNSVVCNCQDDYEAYCCAECGSTIIERIVATDGEPATAPRPAPMDFNRLILHDEINWDTVEIWWTNLSNVAAVHGRTVLGNPELLDFAKEIVSIYDEST